MTSDLETLSKTVAFFASVIKSGEPWTGDCETALTNARAASNRLAENTDRQTPKLRAALLVVLDQVDYTNGACGVTEMVGAVLPKEVITRAREALE